MDSRSLGDLVSVATGGPEVDGIVFDAPSATKVIVAVVDRARGPVLRTFHPDTLSDRTAEGPDDKALRLLLRRTPPPVHGAARDGSNIGRRRAGHTRAATHRSPGR
jgi:hypothetical protein